MQQRRATDKGQKGILTVNLRISLQEAREDTSAPPALGRT